MGDLEKRQDRVKELEAVEMRMIDNLKNTQQRELDATRELQTAME